jgi:riboflavin kinase/FMN adenylyltransferase
MKVYQGIESFTGCPNPVVTAGTFDGVHMGHQKILTRLKDLAQRENGETVVITFFPHPRLVLFPDDNDLKQINTLNEKIDLLEGLGIDHLIIQEFTKEFSRLSSVEFVRNLLVNKIGTKILVIGYDHRFGRNREGSFEHLKEYGPLYGFEVEEIPKQVIDDVSVSSTKIRTAVIEGDIKKATDLLGHHFSVHGTVIKGQRLGHSIGFPTANIHIKESYKLIPSDGVYAVTVKFDGEMLGGMLNIGYRPTVGGKSRTIEVNIFNLDRDLYGKELELFFLERIRDEKKFDGLDALKKQLFEDRELAVEIIQHLHPDLV